MWWKTNQICVSFYNAISKVIFWETAWYWFFYNQFIDFCTFVLKVVSPKKNQDREWKWHFNQKQMKLLNETYARSGIMSMSANRYILYETEYEIILNNTFCFPSLKGNILYWNTRIFKYVREYVLLKKSFLSCLLVKSNSK